MVLRLIETALSGGKSGKKKRIFLRSQVLAVSFVALLPVEADESDYDVVLFAVITNSVKNPIAESRCNCENRSTFLMLSDEIKMCP